MHILVCVKQVPDTTEVRIDPETNTLDRSSAPAIINPYDSHAVEEAVRIKEKVGGKVTVLSMGPPAAVEVIKRCIMLGADEGYLLSDRAFAGSDTLATSYILAKGIEVISHKEPIDLIFCGKQAIDGDTAQVGPGIARRLGMPQLTYVKNVVDVDTAKREVQVHRKLDDGHEVVVSKLPCLITVEKEINDLRYESLPNMLRAARYQPTILGMTDLGADPVKMGLKGSPTSVSRIFAPSQRGEGEILKGSEQEIIKQLVQKLSQRAI
ncbi:electron transfer flavoprotein beta-subunit [Desulforamulus reducens MI-1]|uniref:Electron transfer flavoprotein small subunit n=1 Tax=Desulforamulus reducens (strain ATCC BAA-1160 / DSM 100696 / MI-1) TaxID=349161 RepID=A4J4R3_DESRM|nr:electron transfer flavoprotein subunit beta/FixA family protein [Desulforamulus reducens]ABO50066.1 electron transfer flavoprotein beta-subunit [Desulforamulus reducens MI-1]